MKIEVYISPPNENDVESYLKCLNDITVHNNTLTIPFPYTEEDAKNFLNFCEQKNREFNRVMNWAIRKADGELIGGIGFHGISAEKIIREEVGYWLAEPYRGKGILPKILNEVCEIGFMKYNFRRIEAPVFEWNNSSARVLEKCGFQFEGLLLNYYLKNNLIINCRMYAKIN